MILPFDLVTISKLKRSSRIQPLRESSQNCWVSSSVCGEFAQGIQAVNSVKEAATAALSSPASVASGTRNCMRGVSIRSASLGNVFRLRCYLRSSSQCTTGTCAPVARWL